MSHQKNKVLLLAAMVALLALPATAIAGTCGVLPFSAGPGVNRGAAPNITALVSSELDIRGGYDLVIAADPADFEGGDCGASTSCIKQFGQANKHEAVVAGKIVEAGDDAYKITLTLHDGRTAGALRTVVREVPSSADLLMDAVASVVVELVTGEAPDEEEQADAAAETGPLYDDLDFDELMEDADEEVTPNNRKRGRAAPRNPGQDDGDRRRDDVDEDDPFELDDELDALDLSAEEMDRKKRDRERQAQLDREREAEDERKARERAEEERRQRIAEERAREEESRMRAEREERDRRARADRERREEEERMAEERAARQREEDERQARADRERRQREEADRAEKDRARQQREDDERQARVDRDRKQQEDEQRQARADRERRDREAAEQTERDERQARADRTARTERDSRSASRARDDGDRDGGYARDEDMSSRVHREKERRRAAELDRAERERDDSPSAVALAPATGILIGSAFDDDEEGGGIFIGPDDDDDDYESGILMGAAAEDIDFSDDVDDADGTREGMIISGASDEENPGVRRRREAEQGDDRYARARTFGDSPSDDDYSRRDQEDRDARSGAAEREYDRDGEDSDTESDRDRRERDRSSRVERDYDRDRGSSERVASRDDSYLSDEYDEYDLDGESYAPTRSSSGRSKVKRTETRSGNRPWFSGRVVGGYTNYYLHFAQYGVDLAFFPVPRVSVDVQVDFWTLSIRECPECDQEYRTLPSFYVGGSYRFTNLKIVQPYVGGDIGGVVYAIGTLDDGAGNITRRPLVGAAFEVKGGVDFMFTRHFGVGAGLKAGLAYASKIKENVHPDWNPLQFLLNARIAAVVQF